MRDIEIKQINNSDLSDSIEYVRRVFKHNLDWYNNADSKAEIILALDGVFLTLITSSIFIKQAELESILKSFTAWTWLFLGLMTLCLTASIICAIVCLWSRIPLFTKCAKKKYFKKHQIEDNRLETYVPETTFFFQKISWLDPDLYQKRMLSVDQEFEIMALAADTHTLSKNVLKKHLWVDFSFTLAGFSLLFFLALGISYLLALV